MFFQYIVKIRYIGSKCYTEKDYFGITPYFDSVWVPYFEPGPRTGGRAVQGGPRHGALYGNRGAGSGDGPGPCEPKKIS